MSLLFVLFIVVPIVELVLIIQVGQVLGAWNTVFLLVLDSLLGAWLVKRQGIGILRKSQERLRKGEMPSEEIVAGMTVLFAGALMLTPGFLTDLFGLLMLIPPIRKTVLMIARRRFRSRLSGNFSTSYSEEPDIMSSDEQDSDPFGDIDR